MLKWPTIGTVTIQDNVVDKGMLTTDVAGDGLTGGNDTALAISGAVSNATFFGQDGTTFRSHLHISGSNEDGAGRYFSLQVTAGILTITDIGIGSL